MTEHFRSLMIDANLGLLNFLWVTLNLSITQVCFSAIESSEMGLLQIGKNHFSINETSEL